MRSTTTATAAVGSGGQALAASPQIAPTIIPSSAPASGNQASVYSLGAIDPPRGLRKDSALLTRVARAAVTVRARRRRGTPRRLLRQRTDLTCQGRLETDVRFQSGDVRPGRLRQKR